MTVENNASNLFDAAAQGAIDGGKLVINIIVILLSFLALIALCNLTLRMPKCYFTLISIESIGTYIFRLSFPLTVQYLFSYAFFPFAVMLGVPFAECYKVATLLGIKTVVNEFVAFAELQNMKSTLSLRSEIIATYALCGFSNFSSIGIQIGSLAALGADRATIASLGTRSLIAATFACLMTANIAGILVPE